jgi:YqaJ-like viral recombinase domain
VTPAKGELSKSSVKYAYRLITERLLNTPLESVEGQGWMDRGKELEPMAVKQYEFVTELETEPVGFITTDDGLIGASPDRLIKGRAIGLEIKSPASQTHLGYLLDGPGTAYRPQVQGQLYVAELERADFYSYHPRMPAYTLATRRDEPYIKLLAAALAAFNEQLYAMTERARSLGVFQAYERILTPIEKEEADDLAGRIMENGMN